MSDQWGNPGQPPGWGDQGGSQPPGWGQPPQQPAFGQQGGFSPPPGGYAPGGQKPGNQLVPAILTTLFCCLPFGIVSIVFAAKVDGAWNSGDYAGAQENAKKARTWWIASAAVGGVIAVIYIILIVGGIATTGFS